MKNRYLFSSVLVALAMPVLPLAAQPLQVGQTFLANGTDPTLGSNGWSLTSHGIGQNLFAVDQFGVLVPEVAAGAERIDELTWHITLAPDRHFSDGTPVTAETVGAGLANTIAVNPTARATGGALQFEAIDTLTLAVTTERPVPVIQALFAEWPLVVYHLGEAGAVFTGPYAVDTFNVDSNAVLIPNPYFPGAEERSEVNLRRFSDAQTLALAFESGELDLAFGLPAEVLPRLRTNPDLTIKSFPVGYQYLAWYNTEDELLSDVTLRRAIDLSIDREELVLAIDGGEPATGAFAPYFPFAGTEARIADLEEAARLLDEAGWIAGADGYRTKDGERLVIDLVTYPSRPDLVTMLPVVRAALARVGIDSETRVVENPNDVAASGDYDVFLWAQHTAPTGDPAFFFDSMLRTGGGINHSHYADPEFDALIDGFATQGDPEARIALARAAQDYLGETVPVSFLVAPYWHVGLSDRLAGYEPWGSDYHVLRADIGEAR